MLHVASSVTTVPLLGGTCLWSSSFPVDSLGLLGIGVQDVEVYPSHHAVTATDGPAIELKHVKPKYATGNEQVPDRSQNGKLGSKAVSAQVDIYRQWQFHSD